MKNLSNGIFVSRIAGLPVVQSLPILPVSSQKIRIRLSVESLLILPIDQDF
jgi:hypothetical protein